jgi:hypothetical protein
VFLAFGDDGSDAGAGVEAGDACAAGAHAFGEGALGAEFDFELAGEVLAFELGVFADVAGDHLFDLAIFEQEPRPQPSTPALLLAMVRLRTPVRAGRR